jgi:hypothetical protein
MVFYYNGACYNETRLWIVLGRDTESVKNGSQGQLGRYYLDIQRVFFIAGFMLNLVDFNISSF